MKLKKTIRPLAQWVILSIIMLILWTISIAIMPLLFNVDTNASPDGVSGFLLAMIVVSFINTAVIMYPIYRSRWHGIKLITAVALVLYAVQFFLVEIEAIFFRANVNIPIELVYTQLAGGVIFALLFVSIAVVILGKMKKLDAVQEVPNKRLIMPKGEFFLKVLTLIVIVYPLMYFLFGYFIAWQFPAIRKFYSGSTTILPFLKHIHVQLTTNTILIFWQMARGFLWVLIALPVIRMMKGTIWKTAITVGLIFAVIMNSQHLLPNPYMPSMVRLAHFIETASSNFIWGMIIAWLMYRSHTSFVEFIRKQA